MTRIILHFGLVFGIGLSPTITLAAPFDEFPSIPCADLNSVGDEDHISLWLHGFLSGVNWVDSEHLNRELASISEVKERVTQVCTDSPNGEITASVLNRLYDVSRSN